MKENSPLSIPQEKGFRLAVSISNDLFPSGMEMPARSEAALSAAIRIASAPTIRCRSAHLVEVETNLLLPTMHTVSIMRTAASEAMPHSASCLPPSKRHSRLTTVRRGCCQVATRRDSWRSHVHRTRLRSACSHSSYKLPMSGVEGYSPRLSLGDSKGVFSPEREYPLWCRGAHAAPPPALARENQGTPLEKGVKKDPPHLWQVFF